MANPTCDMDRTCTAPVTHIDNKGYVYCATHGVERRDVRPCRKMRPFEVKRIMRGEPLARY